MQHSVLIVEDDHDIAGLLQVHLNELNLHVDHVTTGEAALAQLAKQDYQVILLDIMLPTVDGLTLCREIKTKMPEVSVVLLTSKSSEMDRIIGLEMGADDYLPKPFNPRELLARAKAVLRRRSSEAPGAPSKDVQIVEFGNYKLNLATREMTAGDTPLTLTSGEFAVLKSLVTHPREPLSRDKLMNLARGRDYSALERSIDVQVSRLRRMLEEDPANPRYIQTVWGLGYVFVPDGEQV